MFEEERIGLVVQESGKDTRQFYVRLGTASKLADNEFFCPSRAIRELVAEGKLRTRPRPHKTFYYLGLVSFMIHRRQKEVEFRYFHPVGKDSELSRSLEKKGVGEILHVAIVGRLCREFPNYKIKKPVAPLPGLAERLKRFGIKKMEDYSIGEYYEKILRAYRRGKRKGIVVRARRCLKRKIRRFRRGR